MITLTTIRPVLQFPSTILSESMTCNDRSLLATTGATKSSSGSPISQSMMHPDNLLLHNHGVTSPRLNSTSSSASGSITNTAQFKNCDSPPLVSFCIKDTSSSHDSHEQRDDIPDISSSYSPDDTIINKESSNLNSSSFYSNNSNDNNQHHLHHHSDSIAIVSSNNNNHNNKNNIDNITDRMSCCSDDSELSVGQECCDNVNNSENCNSNHPNYIRNNSNMINDDDDSDRINHLSNNNLRTSVSSNSNNKPVNDDSESIDNVSSLSDTDNNRITSVIGDNNIPSDEISDGSSPHRDVLNDSILMGGGGGGSCSTSTGINNILSSSSTPPIIRPSPTRLQEEFLKKSHLYAEEFMKQQMQFMAAARVSAFSLRHPSILPEFGKINFRPHHIKQQLEINDNLLNINGIHSHLSVISKLSSQINNSNESTSVNNLNNTFGGLSRETSQSPPSLPLNQFHAAAHHAIHQHHQHHHHHPFINNELHETNLKFSIDNILKADFGRRITDPILKRNNSCHLNASNNVNKGYNLRKSPNNKSVEHTVDNNKNATPIDLTNLSSSLQLNDTINNLNSNCSNNSVNSNSTIAATLLLSDNNNKNHHQSHHHNISSKLLTGTINTTNVNAVAAAAAAVAVSTTSVSQTPSLSSSSSSSLTSSTSTSTTLSSESGGNNGSNSSSSSGGPMVWPAWVYCTRYSDRPSSGPRTRKPKKSPGEKGSTLSSSDEKRPRTAFSGPQLARLKHEFSENRYLTERRRQQLSAELGLNEAQIKIWFQNKRAKIKKASGTKNPLALQLMAQGLYNHSTVPLTREEEELQELQAKSAA